MPVQFTEFLSIQCIVVHPSLSTVCTVFRTDVPFFLLSPPTPPFRKEFLSPHPPLLQHTPFPPRLDCCGWQVFPFLQCTTLFAPFSKLSRVFFSGQRAKEERHLPPSPGKCRVLKLLRQWEEEGKKFLMNEIDRPAAADFFYRVLSYSRARIFTPFMRSKEAAIRSSMCERQDVLETLLAITFVTALGEEGGERNCSWKGGAIIPSAGK